MKKFFYSFLIVLFVCFDIVAQNENFTPSVSDNSIQVEEVETKTESELKKAGVLKQSQTFSWKAVPNARKYEVNIEVMAFDGTWKPSDSEQTTDTSLEMLLYPGDYRISISAFNVLGRKATSTSWVEFRILDEKEPFLFSSSFGYNEKYNASAIYIDRNSDIESDNLSAKTLTLKGKNIFFEETSFCLVPTQTPLDSVEFSEVVNRKEVFLPIVKRDRDTDAVTVSYDADKIFSGYYSLEVRNPEGFSYSQNLLVFDGRQAQINTDTFKYDKRYKVPVITLERTPSNKGEVVPFIITGLGIAGNSEFSLVPTSGSVPYPFESVRVREKIDLPVLSRECLDDDTGAQKLEFSLDPAYFETGYYAFSVTEDDETFAKNFLFIVETVPEKQPIVNDIKIKIDSTTQAVSLNVKGKNLSVSGGAVLVAPYSEKDGTNKKIPLQLESRKDAEELVLTVAESVNLEPGTYALYLEGDSGSFVEYVDVAIEKYSVAKSKIEDEQKVSVFMRPEEAEEIPEVDDLIESVGYQKVYLTAGSWIQTHNNDLRSKYLEETMAEQKTIPLEVTDSKEVAILEENITSSEGETLAADISLEDIESLQNSITLGNGAVSDKNASLGQGENEEPEETSFTTAKFSPNLTFSYSGEPYYSSQVNYDPEIVAALQSGNAMILETGIFYPRLWSVELVVDNAGTIEYWNHTLGNPLDRYRENGKYIYTLYYEDFKPLLPTTNILSIKNIKGLAFRSRNNLIEENQSLTVYDMEIYNTNTTSSRLREKDPKILPFLGITLGYSTYLNETDKVWDIGISNFILGARLDLFDLGWLRFEGDATFNSYTGNTEFDITSSIGIPSKIFNPYIGAGYGVYCSDSPQQFIPMFAGFTLKKYFDFRYSLRLFNSTVDNDSSEAMGKPKYYDDCFTVSVRLRLRPVRFVPGGRK